MIPATHYVHSGKSPMGGIVMTLVAGSIVGAILGAIYAALIYWIPFVFLLFILTIGLGAVLGAMSGAIAAAGKIRHNGMTTQLAFVVALVAYYVHWVVWMNFMTGEWLLKPTEVWIMMNRIAATGAWTVFNWTPQGFSLWAIWGIEGAVIVGLGALGAHTVTDMPFCEATNQWTKENTLATRFRAVDPSQPIDSPSALLGALVPEHGTTGAFAEVTVFTAPGSELRCVTLDSVTLEYDDDGKEEKNKKTVVKQMIFDRGSYDKLMSLNSGQVAEETPAGWSPDQQV